MPNLCDFKIRVKGNKNNIMYLYKWLNANYNYIEGEKNYVTYNGEPVSHHIGGRVFEAYYDEKFFDQMDDSDDNVLDIFGNCAWSCHSCMLDGPYTYYNDLKQDLGDKYKGLTLNQACELLHLELELYSGEPGMGFAEHLYINNKGKIIVDEETEYYEYEDENSGDWVSKCDWLDEDGQWIYDYVF